MNQQVLDKYFEVLDEFVENSEPFTAFDVTKEVRKRIGRGTYIQHHEYRQAVHDYMSKVVDDEVYEVSQHPTLPAQEYSPTGVVKQQNPSGVPAGAAFVACVNPATGSFLGQSLNTPSTQALYSGLGITQPTTGKLKTKKSLDVRGKLLIGSNFINKAGLKRGDFVNVNRGIGSQSDTVVITNSARKTNYRVDVRNNIRIDKKYLPKASNYNIEVVPGSTAIKVTI